MDPETTGSPGSFEVHDRSPEGRLAKAVEGLDAGVRAVREAVDEHRKLVYAAASATVERMGELTLATKDLRTAVDAASRGSQTWAKSLTLASWALVAVTAFLAVATILSQGSITSPPPAASLPSNR